MWLLSTDRAELHYFARNFGANGGYAILSHTWVGKEQTFQEVQAIGEQCLRDGTNPRDFVHDKIRSCGMLAEKHGYRWLWIDSCCIDKTSSSELSEAINSMYRWDKEAEVCYPYYLADVPRDCVLHAPGSAFRKSRWDTRGWTLQELIAPDFLIFLSADWHELGNKAALAALLWEITGVPPELLTGDTKPGNYSVCNRMHFASKRKTTRVEDEAYCLMGLFGVSMPTNYGEGKQAFIRLQYEIMQRNPDMSLFAFGNPVYQDHSVTFHPQESESNNPHIYLIADSPRDFHGIFCYVPELGTNAKQQYPPPPDSTVAGPFDVVELPRLTATSYGVELRAPIYEADGITIAVILYESGGRHWGLFLTRDRTEKDPTLSRYFTTCVFSEPNAGSGIFIARMVNLGDDLYNLAFDRKSVKAFWRTIYVVPTASDSDNVSPMTPNVIINCNPTSPFRVPRWLIARFTTLQFHVSQFRATETLQVPRIFHIRDSGSITVLLGSCAATGPQDPDQPPPLWARASVEASFHVDTKLKFMHDCSEDHLDAASWATRSKVFGDVDGSVRLSLTPSVRMEENVFVIHLELFGHIFEEILREAAISFPSLADLEKDRPRLEAPRDTVTSSQR